MGAWNDAIGPGYDWTAQPWVSMINAAMTERSLASGRSIVFPVSTNVGDDIQSSTFLNSIQFDITSLMFGFFDPVTPLTTPGVPAFTTLSIARTRQLAGLPGSDWRRTRPREINTTTSTSDTQGNPAVTGQKAWLLTGTNAGRLHKYTGAVPWVIADPVDGPPDVLDSNLASPNHVNTGSCLAGDYLDIPVSEIRDTLNQMICTPAPITGAAAPPIFFGNVDLTEGVDFATLEADADAAYTTSTLFTQQTPKKYAILQSAGPRALKNVTQGQIAANARTSAMAKSVTFYGRFSGVSPPSLDPATITDTNPYFPDGWFDALETVGPTTNATVLSSFYPSDTTPEPWPTPPAAGHSVSSGWAFNAFGAIARWDVAGGFQFTASS